MLSLSSWAHKWFVQWNWQYCEHWTWKFRCQLSYRIKKKITSLRQSWPKYIDLHSKLMNLASPAPQVNVGWWHELPWPWNQHWLGGEGAMLIRRLKSIFLAMILGPDLLADTHIWCDTRRVWLCPQVWSNVEWSLQLLSELGNRSENADYHIRDLADYHILANFCRPPYLHPDQFRRPPYLHLVDYHILVLFCAWTRPFLGPNATLMERFIFAS